MLFPAPIRKRDPQLLQIAPTSGAAWGSRSVPWRGKQPSAFQSRVGVIPKNKKTLLFFFFLSIAERALTLQAACHGPAAVWFPCLRPGHGTWGQGARGKPNSLQKGVCECMRCSRKEMALFFLCKRGTALSSALGAAGKAEFWAVGRRMPAEAGEVHTRGSQRNKRHRLRHWVDTNSPSSSPGKCWGSSSW